MRVREAFSSKLSKYCILICLNIVRGRIFYHFPVNETKGKKSNNKEQTDKAQSDINLYFARVHIVARAVLLRMRYAQYYENIIGNNRTKNAAKNKNNDRTTLREKTATANAVVSIHVNNDVI